MVLLLVSAQQRTFSRAHQLEQVASWQEPLLVSLQILPHSKLLFYFVWPARHVDSLALGNEMRLTALSSYFLAIIVLSDLLPRVRSACTKLIGASLTWDISRSFDSSASNRQVRYFLRSAFDVQDCTSPCTFTVGSAPTSNCGDDFGQICIRKSQAQIRSCTYNSATDKCDFVRKNSNMIVMGQYGDLNALPTPSSQLYNDAPSIGARKYIYGEMNFTYNVVPYNTSDLWLEAWFSYVNVIVPQSKLILSLALPIKNFYSPVPMLPLFIPVPFNGFSVQLKAYDYDGQPMVVGTVGSDYTTATSSLLYSDSFARSVAISSCCQCPLPSGITPNAFFDLSTEPNGFIGPAPSALYDGPTLVNRSGITASGGSTIDVLPATSAQIAVDGQRVQVLDAIFASLWQDPATAGPRNMDQQSTTSTTAETYLQISRNPSSCGPSNTPSFLAPTVTEFTCPYNQIGSSPCDEIALLANGSSAAQPVRIVPAVGFPYTDGMWLAAEQVRALYRAAVCAPDFFRLIRM